MRLFGLLERFYFSLYFFLYNSLQFFHRLAQLIIYNSIGKEVGNWGALKTSRTLGSCYL